MAAWINIVVLVVSGLLMLTFYVRSVSPAALEKKIGPGAYKRCTRYRVLSGVFMIIACVNYVLTLYYPLPLSLPRTFPWSRWISALIAAVIAIPSGYLFYRGLRDAGEETMIIRKDHTLYRGIYEKIRHPQMAGEVPLWWAFAFLLHSPFLVLISFIWVPIFVVMCLAEEQDLVLRYGEAYEAYRKRTGFFFPRRRRPGRDARRARRDAAVARRTHTPNPRPDPRRGKDAAR